MENREEIPKFKEETEIEHEFDILDTTKFVPACRQLITCGICNQKFTNKLKILMHYVVNHQFKLCPLCSNYAFKYDSDKIQHEQLHLPIGCSSCDHEFSKYCIDSISKHYKESHQSFLCNFCSGVIQPFSKYPEHVEKKHNTISYSKLIENNDKIFEIVEESDGPYFNCLMCDKKKHHSLLFGHFIFYHNLSVHTLKKYIDMTPQIKINGSSLSASSSAAAVVPEIEDRIGEKEDKKCTVCDNELDDEPSKKELHGVFCRGFVVCKQCTMIFKNDILLKSHMEKEHPSIGCKFGCKETLLSPDLVNEHLKNRHDITECFLCNIINSSEQFKNHLRDQHKVNLMTYEKAMGKAKNKLYRAERNSQVLCNFCDKNLTNEIKEFSFINHYKDQHEITTAMILQNLDKNPIIDVILSNKNSKDDDTLKNFAVVNSLEKFVETDFDASKVYCIGVEHVEQKPFFMIESDSLSSKLICDFCSKQFDVACRLYEHLTSIHGFRLLNLNDCDECHSKWQSESSDEDSKAFNLSLVCPFDESFHVTKDNFKDHLAAEHLDDSMDVNSIIYKCIVCSYTFKNLEDIRGHFNTYHPDVKIKYCKICRFKLPSDGSDDEHFSKNHAKDIETSIKFCCKLCPKEFKKSTTAMTHYKKTHNTKKRASGQYKCHFQECIQVFRSTEDRKMHVIIEHPNENPFKCKNCEMTFMTKGSLSSHSMKHKNLVYVCEFCSKNFTRRDSYKEHLLIHSDVRLKCSFCEKVFVQRSNLIRHERIHLQEKPYTCRYCEKSFSDKGACKSHENVHTKEEASNCEVCGKHFARKLKLKYHMRLHTLENVVTCDVCNKNFGESYSLRKHRETHEKEEKIDKCKVCNKIFKSSRALKNHQKVHKEEEEDDSLVQTRITCTICNMNEFTTTTIKAHLAEVHQVNGSNWENYVDEVEFEMDIEPEMIVP